MKTGRTSTQRVILYATPSSLPSSPDKFSHPDPPRVDLAQPCTINNFKGTKAAKLGPPLSSVMTNELLPSFAH